MAKKIKKAILAGLTAYAASKMMGKKGLKGTNVLDYEGDALIPKKKPFMHDLEAISPKKPPMLGDKGKSMDHMVPKKWYEFWKKHGGSVTTAKLGKMIKAAQGTYAREDESLGMRLGKGKGTAKERDMSYGDWGKRKTDWASKGKMVKARGGVYVNTKLNGKLFTETF